MKTRRQIEERIAELRMMIDVFDAVNAEDADWELHDGHITEIYTLEWVIED